MQKGSSRGVAKFGLILSPKAARDLDGLSDAHCLKTTKAINVLSANPFPRGKIVKKIRGVKSDFYRLRVDKYRVFYMIDGSSVVILRIISKKDSERFIRSLA